MSNQPDFVSFSLGLRSKVQIDKMPTLFTKGHVPVLSAHLAHNEPLLVFQAFAEHHQ